MRKEGEGGEGGEEETRKRKGRKGGEKRRKSNDSEKKRQKDVIVHSIHVFTKLCIHVMQITVPCHSESPLDQRSSLCLWCQWSFEISYKKQHDNIQLTSCMDTAVHVLHVAAEVYIA